MGKRTRSQRKGRKKKRSTHKSKGKIKHKKEVKGKVVDILHDPARTAPVAEVKLSSGEKELIIAPEGIQTGDKIECGISAGIEHGNTLPLSEIPEGTPIYNIESTPGDGGKFARSSGTHGFIVMHDKGKTTVRLPSKKAKDLNPSCRASIGVVSGGGRKEKPYLKAGKKRKAFKTKGKQYPKVSGVSMNAVDHPFGGSTKPGIPKTINRNMPPGKKVGSISAKRTGKKKK